jgi:hypothetical protein
MRSSSPNLINFPLRVSKSWKTDKEGVFRQVVIAYMQKVSKNKRLKNVLEKT